MFPILGKKGFSCWDHGWQLLGEDQAPGLRVLADMSTQFYQWLVVAFDDTLDLSVNPVKQVPRKAR